MKHLPFHVLLDGMRWYHKRDHLRPSMKNTDGNMIHISQVRVGADYCSCSWHLHSSLKLNPNSCLMFVLTVCSTLLGFSNCLDLVFKLEVSVWGPEQTNCLCFMFYILPYGVLVWIIWWDVKMVHVCPYTLLWM